MKRTAVPQFLVCLAAVAGIVAIVPLAAVIYPLPAFYAVQGSLMLSAYVFTGVIALVQFRATKRASLAILGATFLVCSVFVAAGIAPGPGVISTLPAMHSGSARTWTFIAWMIGFAAGGFAYALAERDRARGPATWPRSNPTSIAIAALAVAVTCVLAIGLFAPNLPSVINVAAPPFETSIPILVVLFAVALFFLARLPGKTQLDLWFMTAQFLVLTSLIAYGLNPTTFAVPSYYALELATASAYCVLGCVVKAEYERYRSIMTAIDELSTSEQEEQNRFAETVNSTASGIAHVDASGKVLFANDQLCSMLGTSPGVLSRVPSLFGFIEVNGSNAALSGGTVLEGSFEWTDGSKRWLEFSLTSAPESAFYIVVVNDITARRSAEEATVHLNEIKAQFIATMSDEIRIPLSGIVGVSELFKRTAPLSERQKRFAEAIDESAKTLLQLVNDILDFSKIEASRIEIKPTLFDLVALVDSIRDSVAEVRRKGIHVFAEVAPSLGGGLYGDAIRLRQILDNLIANAVKFTQAGHVLLTASEVETKGSRVLVRFRVEDTGVGIPREAQASIFEAFSQADASTAHRFGGIGLGLTIVKRLVELMEGRITLDSDPGRGSTFSFDLWFEREVHGQRLDTQATLLRGLRGLIFSADADLRLWIGRRMLAWGMRAEHATDSGRAINRYDCVVVDAAHPGAAAFIDAACSDPSNDNVRFVLIASADEPYPFSLPAWRYRALGREAVGGTLYNALVDLCIEEQRTASRSIEQLGFVPMRSERILVAEDNEINRMLTLAQLEELEYGADFVEDGAAAIAVADADVYALIFMDSQMPNVNGLEATAAIRKAEAATGRHVPIIAMTANVSPNYRGTCLSAGMDDYIAKPVLLDALQAMLEKWLIPGSRHN